LIEHGLTSPQTQYRL